MHDVQPIERHTLIVCKAGMPVEKLTVWAEWEDAICGPAVGVG